jgi:AI-2 transport protein TqsA
MAAHDPRTLTLLLSVLVVIAAAGALRVTYFVTMPLVFAFFVTVLVWPMHEAVRRRLPGRIWWVSTALTVLVVLLGLAGVVGLILLVVFRVVSDRGTELLERWSLHWEALTAWLAARGLPAPATGDGGELLSRVGSWAGSAALSLTGTVFLLVLVVLFVALMLIEARRWQEKSRAAFAPASAERIMDAAAAVTRQVRAFLLVQAFVAFLTAVVTGLWLWAMGVPLVLLWSSLTFVVDFVPNVGPILAGILVSLVALLALGWRGAIVTGLGVLVIQNVFGNYVNPILQGRRLSISPLVVLLSVVFWAWVWGPVGAIIAIPITATLIIACAHVPALRPIALLLSRTGDEQELARQTGS